MIGIRDPMFNNIHSNGQWFAVKRLLLVRKIIFIAINFMRSWTRRKLNISICQTNLEKQKLERNKFIIYFAFARMY